jgi:hypothetical protein
LREESPILKVRAEFFLAEVAGQITSQSRLDGFSIPLASCPLHETPAFDAATDMLVFSL